MKNTHREIDVHIIQDTVLCQLPPKALQSVVGVLHGLNLLVTFSTCTYAGRLHSKKVN